MCKIMISPGVFKKFTIVNTKIIWFLLAHSNNFFKYLFFKSISKCQKEIPSCAPPSSHVCDFQNNDFFGSGFSG